MEVSGQIQAPAAFFLRKEGSRRGLECFREQKEIFYASSQPNPETSSQSASHHVEQAKQDPRNSSIQFSTYLLTFCLNGNNKNYRDIIVIKITVNDDGEDDDDDDDNDRFITVIMSRSIRIIIYRLHFFLHSYNTIVFCLQYSPPILVLLFHISL